MKQEKNARKTRPSIPVSEKKPVASSHASLARKLNRRKARKTVNKKVSAFYQKDAEKDGKALQAYLVEDDDHDYTCFKGYERDEG